MWCKETGIKKRFCSSSVAVLVQTDGSVTANYILENRSKQLHVPVQTFFLGEQIVKATLYVYLMGISHRTVRNSLFSQLPHFSINTSLGK